MFHYYTRINSSGQAVTTSYDHAARMKSIAENESKATNKKYWSGEMFFNTKTGDYGAAASGCKLRSFIASKGGLPTGGRFAVFSKLSDGTPNDLGLRFKDFASGNAFIKNVVDSYGALWLVEIETQGSGKPEQDPEIDYSEEAPF